MENIEKNRNASATVNTLFEIFNAVNKTDNFYDIYASIYESLNKILKIENFAIALYHEERDSLTFPYFADEMGTNIEEIFCIRKNQSLPARIINAGKPMLFYQEDIINMSTEMERIPSREICRAGAATRQSRSGDRTRSGRSAPPSVLQ